MSNHPATQPALLFIPDISGFTRFISSTEIDHSKHIIEELLEILVDANDLGLQVSEIEGDAILFYRFGTAPTAAELAAQVQKMFVRFHAHLRRYDSHRICQCGACGTASQLTLKFVAHYGPVATNQIKQYRKLFGREVIVVHRLLKNSIEHHEYALFTENLVRACANWVDLPTIAWADLEHGTEEYDAGNMAYCYLPLAPLLAYVPEPEVADYSIPGVKVPIVAVQGQVKAPIDLVFSVFADLPLRSKWIPGTLDTVENLNHYILQAGSRHRCTAGKPVKVTHDYEQGEDRVSFTETDETRNFCFVYTLRRIDEQTTEVEANGFMRRNWLRQLWFRWFQRRRYVALYQEAFANLNHFCSELVRQNQAHAYRIVLRPAAA